MKKRKNANRWKMLVLFILVAVQISYCKTFANDKIIVFSQRYPDIYLSFPVNSDSTKHIQYNLNNQPVYASGKSLISKRKTPVNIIVLIDNASFYADRSTEGKKNHFLLELCNFFEEKPSLLFSYLVNEKISAFELNRENILSLKTNPSDKVRLADAIILSNNHIAQKNTKDDSLILVIGSGMIKGDIESSFIPQCPIIYLHPANAKINDDFFSFMVKASGGHFKEIPESHFQEFIKDQLTISLEEDRHIAHFRVPWKAFRIKNHFTAQSPHQNLKITFPLPIKWKLSLLFLSGLLCLIVAFLIMVAIKKRRRSLRQKKTHHAYLMAILMISNHHKRYEVRISKCDFLIGSSKNCDCVIDDFDLSSTHCMIKEKNGIHEVIDLNSRNGVYVNGRKVEQCYLRHEDVIVMGSSCLIYKLGNMSYVSDKKVL